MQFISISRRLAERYSDDQFAVHIAAERERVRELYREGDEQFAVHIAAERERVRELYREGTVRSIWSRKDAGGAVMLLECADEAAAHAALNSLPLAQRGMLEVQLVPLGPYPAFFPVDS